MKIIERGHIYDLRECIVLFETRAFGRTLNKSYLKFGLTVEELKVQENGHIFHIDS